MVRIFWKYFIEIFSIKFAKQIIVKDRNMNICWSENFGRENDIKLEIFEFLKINI